MDPVRSLCRDAFRMDIAESQRVAGPNNNADHRQLLVVQAFLLARNQLNEADHGSHCSIAVPRDQRLSLDSYQLRKI